MIYKEKKTLEMISIHEKMLRDAIAFNFITLHILQMLPDIY